MGARKKETKYLSHVFEGKTMVIEFTSDPA